MVLERGRGMRGGTDVRATASDYISPSRRNDPAWGPDIYQMGRRQDWGSLRLAREEPLTAFLWLLKPGCWSFGFSFSLVFSSFFCRWSQPPGPQRIFWIPGLVNACPGTSPAPCGLEPLTRLLISLLCFLRAFTLVSSFYVSCSLADSDSRGPLC